MNPKQAAAFTKPTTNLLRGIILRDESDTLVVQASPEDVQAFGVTRGTDVVLARGSLSMSYEEARAVAAGDRALPPLMPGDTIYNTFGQPVGMVTDIHVSHDPIDITTFSDMVRDGRRVMMSGPRRISITAIG